MASALLRFAVEPDPFEDRILIASGLSWHWDLDQSGLSAVAYRRVLARVFEAAGFEVLRTDEPEIAYDPANLFVARIGSRVPSPAGPRVHQPPGPRPPHHAVSPSSIVEWLEGLQGRGRTWGCWWWRSPSMPCSWGPSCPGR